MDTEKTYVPNFLIAGLVNSLLSTDNFTYIPFIDCEESVLDCLAELNHFRGMRDCLYNLHLIDSETFDRIDRCIDDANSVLKNVCDKLRDLE